CSCACRLTSFNKHCVQIPDPGSKEIRPRQYLTGPNLFNEYPLARPEGPGGGGDQPPDWVSTCCSGSPAATVRCLRTRPRRTGGSSMMMSRVALRVSTSCRPTDSSASATFCGS